jgi:hypothetical protein
LGGQKRKPTSALPRLAARQYRRNRRSFRLFPVFSDYLLPAFFIGLALAWLFQTTLFQIFARTQNEILVGWRAGVLSFIVILADFLIASPAIEIMQRITAK